MKNDIKYNPDTGKLEMSPEAFIYNVRIYDLAPGDSREGFIRYIARLCGKTFDELNKIK